MTSSRSADTILHRGTLRSDSESRCTRHFDNGKTSPARPPDVPTNPDRSRTYLVLRAHRMGKTSGWLRPWLPMGSRTSPGLDQHSEEHWPGGLIKSTGSGKSLCKF